MFAYKVAGLAEIVLVLAEHSGYFHNLQLPLGGGQIQQIGIVFAAAHVVSESNELFKSFGSRLTRHPRSVDKVANKKEAKIRINL